MTKMPLLYCLRRVRIAGLLLVLLQSACPKSSHGQSDPLPSWNEGAAKKSIIEFVARVTQADDPSFVPVDERIATFDNDGTLWTEQPMYVQVVFAIARVKELAR
jgi:hypothetical protein